MQAARILLTALLIPLALSAGLHKAKLKVNHSTIVYTRPHTPNSLEPPPPPPPTSIDALAEYNGIYLDRPSGQTYVFRCPPTIPWGVWEKGECNTLVATGFTFESATWRSGIDAFAYLRWPWLNPIDFATQETARKILMWVVSMTANTFPNIEWNVNVEAGRITGPFTRTDQWMVCGDDQRQIQCFAAGQIANKVIRNEPSWARTSWLAEVKQIFTSTFSTSSSQVYNKKVKY